MKKYQDISKEIKDLRKPLRWYGFGGFGLNLIVLIVSFSINFGENKRDYSSMEACLNGMDAIFSNNPTTEHVNESTLADLKKREGRYEIEKIHLIKLIDSYHCDVVIKDLKGYRNYRVALEKNSKFKHLYRIADMSEQEIKSRYQR